MKSICEEYFISDEEYANLEKEFGNLTKYASWQLIKKNAKNNHTDEFEDINQELLLSIIRAGSYYKRQIYIERCFEAAKEWAKDGFIKFVLTELEDLWHNRTRHGANRQKFGFQQEELLYKLVTSLVPSQLLPDKKAPLRIDAKFGRYCKAICWNSQKSMGRKITREKSIRTGAISLSDYDYLATV